MGVKIGAITIQSEHEQEFGVHARRGDMRSGEAGDGGLESFMEGHKAISPRRHRDTEKN